MTWTRLELFLIVAALLLVVLAFYLRGLAARLDRLHLRVDASAAAFDARLERRAALSVEVALSGSLDPASAVLLLNAATTAQHAGEQKSSAESDLSAALRAVFADDETVAELVEDAEARDTLTELGEVCQGVVLARRFANDATRAAVHVRRRGVVRALRLAGHAPWPPSRDLDDAPPEALTALALNSA
jgi:hypothetical protein